MDVLLEAWRQVHEQLGDWQLQIVGDGPQRAALAESCRELKSVTLLGWLNDPWPIYRSASLFVMHSRYEGFPVALIEAMSQRLPCIATRCSEAVDELSRGGTGVGEVGLEHIEGRPEDG